MSKEQQLAEVIADEYETELQPRPNDENDREIDDMMKVIDQETEIVTDSNNNNKVHTTDDIKIETQDIDTNSSQPDIKKPDSPQLTAPDRDIDITGPKRAPTQFTHKQIECWMSMDLHLVDILLAAETFEVNAWLVVFFHDVNQDFANLFESDQLEEIRQQGINMEIYFLFDGVHTL